MLHKATVHSQHEKFKRIRHFGPQESFSLSFNNGVNIIHGPNGSGKSSFLQIVYDYIIGLATTRGESVSGYVLAENPAVEHLSFIVDKGSCFYYFPVERLAPKRMIQSSSPADPSHHLHISLCLERLSLSHGQTTSKIIEDIAILWENNPNGIFAIDEPELALDAPGIIELIRFLKMAAKSSTAQFLIVSHHPFLLMEPDFSKVSMGSDNVCVEATAQYINDLMQRCRQI